MLLLNALLPQLVALPFCWKLLRPEGEETELYLFPCTMWQLALTTSEDIEAGESDACSFFCHTSCKDGTLWQMGGTQHCGL